MYQHVHLRPSRRADSDNIDRSCGQTQINDVTLEKTEVERQMHNKCTEGRRRDGIRVRKEAKGAEARCECTEVGLGQKALLILLALSVTASQLAYDVWLPYPLPL